jgi:hypothetical protein
MSVISSASGSVLITSGALGSNYSGSVAYGPKQVLDGLVLYVDAANPLSYPGSGNLWFDLTKNGYSGALSGSAAVVPSWDSTHQGRIHVKASSSYVSPGVNLATPMSSSFIDFGKILDEVFVGGTTPFTIDPSFGGGSTVTGTDSKFTLNLWFELDYGSQIVQSVASDSAPAINRIWRSNLSGIPYKGNVPALISKFGDNNTIESIGYQTSGLTGRNQQFRLILFDVSQTGTEPPPTSYRYAFVISENPFGSSTTGTRRIQLLNTSPLYRVPNNTPTNICVVFDNSKSALSGDVSLTDNKIKFYVNGYRTQVGDLQTISGVLTNSYIGSNSRLALGAEVGASPRVLEGAINGSSNISSQGTAAQIDAKYYMFQVYNRALTPQEIEQNYFAHRYRFRPWQVL